MGAREQETMDLIPAHERELQAEEARQRDPRLRGREEVDSHAAGAAPARNGPAETASSLAPRPSTSASGGGGKDIVSIMPVTPEEGTPVPKLKRKKAAKHESKKAKALLPDSEPEGMVIDHVTIKHNPRRRHDPSPPIGGLDPAPVIINIDSLERDMCSTLGLYPLLYIFWPLKIVVVFCLSFMSCWPLEIVPYVSTLPL